MKFKNLFSNETDKLTAPVSASPFWDDLLRLIWRSDNTRRSEPIYSDEQFRRFWDARVTEPRAR